MYAAANICMLFSVIILLPQAVSGVLIAEVGGSPNFSTYCILTQEERSSTLFLPWKRAEISLKNKANQMIFGSGLRFQEKSLINMVSLHFVDAL